MATNKSVTVLTPGGRRQNVKVTPNTTILQILEDVCKKHSLKPEEYDLRHHNHVLDTSAIFRFSGLPNNAFLEMSAASKTRQESSEVVLGIQLEDGRRLTGQFTSTNSLWDVIVSLCPEEGNPESDPVIIYMRREVYGISNFKEVTLKSLGIMSGRTMLRLIHRKPEELKVQANISSPIPSKPVEEKPYKRVLQKKIEEEPTETNNSQPIAFKAQKIETAGNFLTQFIKREKATVETNPDANKNMENEQSTPSGSESMDFESVAESDDAIAIDDSSAVGNRRQSTIRESDITFLGERNALAFSLETASSVPYEDLPDEFFDLTIKDAQLILHDLRKQRAEMDEAPLQTTALRNLEQSKKVLRNLNQYKRCVIRIQFPDRTVLQGTFTPVETVEDVKLFVRGYLQEPEIEFHLYMTPPKAILNPESPLIETDCVPSAIVHFGADKQLPSDYLYLRQDLRDRLSSISTASIAALKSRNITPIQKSASLQTGNSSRTAGVAGASSQNTHSPGSSGAHGSGVTRAADSSLSRYDTKVPKWFKPVSK